MLIFLGALPKPMHGMSLINKNMLEMLADKSIVSLNLVPSKFSFLYPGFFWILVKNIYLVGVMFVYLFYLVSYRRCANVYFSIAGGWGKLIDIPFMFLAGVFAKKIYVHHHSFSYCSRYDNLFAVLCAVGRGKIIHIVLCEQMADKLSELYCLDRSLIEVLSNSAFFNDEDVKRKSAPESLLVLGYISNICFEKGIREFIGTYRLLSKNNSQLQAVIAGPCLGDAVASFVQKAVAELPGLTYIGPVYGNDKAKFFAAIDVLVFPTAYVNEAEPVTIYEAFASSVPVVSWDRGCISGMIRNGAGVCIDADDEFVPRAVKTLRLWLEDSDLFRSEVLLAKSRFETNLKIQRKTLNRLVDEIANDA